MSHPAASKTQQNEHQLKSVVSCETLHSAHRHHGVEMLLFTKLDNMAENSIYTLSLVVSIMSYGSETWPVNDTKHD